MDAPRPLLHQAGVMGVTAAAMGQRSADARFIAVMVPHQEGAIAIADLASRRVGRARLRALAVRIRSQRSDERDQMRRWYLQWYGAAVPSWLLPAGGGAADSGLLDAAAMLAALSNARDPDLAFLVRMIAYQRAGLRIASRAQWASRHPELFHLQTLMLHRMRQEIAQMERLVLQWYG